MPAPVGADPSLRAFLDEIEGRIAMLENPKGPTALFPMASTLLTVANALTYINRQVFAADLGVIAYSTGAHWLRADTGGVIV